MSKYQINKMVTHRLCQYRFVHLVCLEASSFETPSLFVIYCSYRLHPPVVFAKLELHLVRSQTHLICHYCKEKYISRSFKVTNSVDTWLHVFKNQKDNKNIITKFDIIVQYLALILFHGEMYSLIEIGIDVSFSF